jgi:hypothetical protein
MENDWPSVHLHSVEAELAELGQPTCERATRDACGIQRAPGGNRPAWLDRSAEVAQPPLPGPDRGAGLDLGL